ncbi:Gfo/Idh/MocA family oxidoreductase [Pelagibacteraceae bacterium]|nr:Gfo/Idh/MocA family oxidoreductase [Pelagibacteraceae bacterium]
MKNKKIIAVVGCGQWGTNLVRNFFELGVLSSVCDLNPSIASIFAEKYNVKNCSFTEILTDQNIKGVVLVVPAELHASMAIDAMNKGKHVFVEKPLSLNQAEANLMITAAKKNNVQLMVGHLLQYHPIFKAIRKMIKNGDIGELQHIDSNRLSFGRVRLKEDVVWSFAPHDISMILSLVGEEPEHVNCQSSSILQKNLSDISSIHMKFKSGIKSDIRVSWISPFKEVKLIVTGKSGILVFDDTKIWCEKLKLHSYEVENLKDRVIKKTKEEYIKVAEEEPLKNECQHFVNVVEGDLKPFTDASEGMRVIKVLIAASLAKENNL